MIILGFNCYGHDSAACLLINGNAVFAVEEERLNRKKHTGDLPVNAIKACLDHAGITFSDIDHITFGWNPIISFLHIPVYIFKYFDKVPSLLRERHDFSLEENLGNMNYLWKMKQLPKHLAQLFPGEKHPKFHWLNHHKCHASSAFFSSGYDEAAIMTLDGAGEWSTATLSVGEGNNIKQIGKVNTPYSLGAFYQAISIYLGFELISGPGKLMGLSSYGKKDSEEYRQMRKMFTLTPDGGFKIDMSYFSYHYTRKSGVSKKFVSLLGPPVNDQNSWTDHHFNIAAAAQRIVEDIILHMAACLKERTGLNNLCIAGGVGLNSVTNGLLVKSKIFDEVFIQPAAGDSGTALGSALYFNNIVMGSPRKYILDTAFLGPEYSSEKYELEIKKAGYPYKKTDDPEIFAAKQLAAGKIIAWFQGRLEYGPRALGNRSILSSPLRPDMKDILNARVKFREGFRPFAGIVLEEDCGEYFDCDYPSPYMLKVYEVKEKYQRIMPSITHVDNTVRIQTVNKTENPPMRKLLEAFKKETGYSAIINTSFNIKGEPIVCTPQDAVYSFQRADIDYLVMGNYIVAKPGVKLEIEI